MRVSDSGRPSRFQDVDVRIFITRILAPAFPRATDSVQVEENRAVDTFVYDAVATKTSPTVRICLFIQTGRRKHMHTHTCTHAYHTHTHTHTHKYAYVPAFMHFCQIYPTHRPAVILERLHGTVEKKKHFQVVCLYRHSGVLEGYCSIRCWWIDTVVFWRRAVELMDRYSSVLEGYCGVYG